MTRIVVCSAWFGDADTLKPTRVRSPHVSCHCLTDRADVVDGWDFHRIDATDHPRRRAREAKTNLTWLPAHDVSIWIDASFELLVNPVDIVAAATISGAPIVGFRHPDRTRISEEAAVLRRWGIAPIDAVARQLADYQAAGFDTPQSPQTVMTTTGLLVRWNCPAVAEFNAIWWREIQRHTLRDQMSIDFCAAICGVPIGYLPGHYRSNPFARYDHRAHRRGRVA